MESLKFEQIPEAVSRIFEKLKSIELMLQNGDSKPTSNTDEILTVKEAAKLLNLKTATVYSLVREDKIPTFKQGNRLYFLRSELIDWIKSGRKKTDAEISNSALGYLSTLKKRR